MTLRDGLVYSKNTITAQVMQKVGAERVVRLAQALGVRQSKLEPVPSLALGTSPVTLREMVVAYGASPMAVTTWSRSSSRRVEDRAGRVLVEFQPKREPTEALPRSHALELVNVMRGVIDEGTGTAIRHRYGITADVAGKTGTTQENTDGWFIMMHPQLVAGARVGFNDKLTMGNVGPGRTQRAADRRRSLPARAAQPADRSARRIRHSAPEAASATGARAAAAAATGMAVAERRGSVQRGDGGAAEDIPVVGMAHRAG
jgi:membrane peptidoglycan carboxypeptidase